MPRLNFIEETDLDAEARALIASAERTGAPDPRVVRVMTRSSAGRARVKCWNSVLYEGRRLVRSLDILSWQEACELDPGLADRA